MGAVRVILNLLSAAALLVVFLGVYLYFTDYEAQAQVTEKGSNGGGDYVVITPDILPSVRVTKYLDSDTASYVCVGYRVAFHVQSQAYQVFDHAGKLVYDSEQGLQDVETAARCKLSNDTGGLLG